MVTKFLVAHEVRFHYTTRCGGSSAPVLAHFTLALTEGEFFCLLGPTTGTFPLTGRPIHGPGVDRAVVFQSDDALFPWLRTINTVAFCSSRTLSSGWRRTRSSSASFAWACSTSLPTVSSATSLSASRTSMGRSSPFLRYILHA